ncbi:MAG: SDR family oxidoreductase [Aliarcobacter sp.]
MAKRIVLITGSSKGLGFELANKFYTKYTLILVSRNICNINVENAIKLNYNLMEEKEVISLCDFLIKKDLIPDILIHNLGGKLDNDTHPINIDVLKETFRLNLEIPISINNFLLERMIKKQNCQIIHISSDSALQSNSSPCYVMAKSSLNTYVQNLAGKLRNKNILIKVFLLGPFIYPNSYWDIIKRTNKEKYKEKIKSLSILEFNTADKIADVIYNNIKLYEQGILILVNNKGDCICLQKNNNIIFK